MLRCQDCEFFYVNPDGSTRLACDPFTTIKEPECLAKLQLVQLSTIARAHQATLDMYERLAPIQEKMMRHMEREIDDADSAEQWKYGLDEDENNP